MISFRTTLTIIVGYLAYRYATTPVVKILSPIVSTENGKVQGIVSISRDGREFYEYLGIPYAKAERFEISVQPDNWEGVRDATEYGAKCTHMDMLVGDIHGEEDCLFLNVHVPKDRKDNKPLPVVVFIHGGHFTEGSSNAHRPEYLMDEDVLLVTINYRLGALGFLNTDDGLVRGNMGLKDQVMSLKWIQRNIVDFGGNPNQVTILGESAGSACVSYHIVSPMSKGLFHKAISQSGVAVSPWTMMTTPKEQAITLGKKLKCPTENMKEMVECLKKKPAGEIAFT
jgi:carboxylesterase type B